MNDGQMVEDVKIAVDSRKHSHFMRSYAALDPQVGEIIEKIKQIGLKGVEK
jgi:hypothetical protein